MKRYAGPLIFLIFFDLFDSTAQRAQEGQFAITFNLPGAVDFLSFPAIQLGLEYKPGKHFAWYGELGVEYLPWNIGGPDTLLLRSHGFKAKTELRYYIKPARYVAFNLFFAADAHNDQV